MIPSILPSKLKNCREIQYKNIYVSNCLVAICESTHTRHHAEHIVVSCIHADSGGSCGAHGVVGHGEDEGGVIDTR